MDTKTSLVAIIGRPNVGKSSLFNRMLGRRKAIVEDISGTTRDRLYTNIEYNGIPFRLVDTGGIDLHAEDKIKIQVKKQAQLALAEADVLLLVCDAISGIAPLDLEIAALIRKYNKKVILVVNKVDNKELEDSVPDFYQLGLLEPIGVSTSHNRGMDILMEEIVKHVKPSEKQETKPAIKVAIAGKPNVGKSSFVNCLLKEERVIVDETPGTTRDAIDVYFTKEGQDYVLIDTAGLRHKRKIKEAVEFFGLSRTKESIRRCDACAFLIDAKEGITNDDLSILNFIWEEGKAHVILMNKWDLMKGITTKEYENLIKERLPFAVPAPIICISALYDKNVSRSLELLKYVTQNSSKQIETTKLNKAFEKYAKELTPPGRKGKKPKIFYVTQAGINPPRFLVFAKRADIISPSYTKYLVKNLAKDFGFEGVPIKIKYREKES